MRRLFLFLLCTLMLFGCSRAKQSNVYTHSLFTASLPDTFAPVKGTNILCFAPYGDPVRSSSITFYTTELNPYFDDFSDAEYEEALKELCGYEDLKFVNTAKSKVDGYRAIRIECAVQVDQGTHDLIIYAVNGDRTYFFTLLNRDGDSFVDAFDAMMTTVRFTEK